MDFKSNSSTQRYNIIKIRIDDGEFDPDKKDFLTTIDNFDNRLYLETIQGKNKFDIFFKEPLKNEVIPSKTTSIRFKESNHIYKILIKEKETIANYLFKSSVGIDPLFLKGGYKKKLSKINKNANMMKKKIHYEHIYNSNDVSTKRRINTPKLVIKEQSKNLGIFENYETNDNPIQGIKKEGNNSNKPPYTSTLNILNSKVQRKDTLTNEFNIPDLNISKEFKIPDDSVFSNRSRIVKKNRFNRPNFVEKLFDTYDYGNLDPWNKLNNHTKNKNLCLSVLKDLYNKITY